MNYSQVKKAIEKLGRTDTQDILEMHDEDMLQFILDHDLAADDADTLEKLFKRYSEEMVEAALALSIQLSDIEECYQGKYRSDADFARELLTEIGDIPKDSPGFNYINWDRAANDLMMDYSEQDGYYFRQI